MANKHLENKSFSIGCIETVKRYGKKIGFATIFNRFKQKGDKLSKFVNGLAAHKLHFNQSINHASEWLNEPEILTEFELNGFKPKTLYRVLECLGRHECSVMTFIQKRLLELYDFKNTNANLDWSSLIIYGDKSNLAERGYSRDGRPDKKQITFGVTQFCSPIDIPFTFTVEAGNVLDKQHFGKTFKRSLKALKEGSFLVLDRGANTKGNKQLIRSKHHHYLCAASLSKSVDVKINGYRKNKAVLVEEKDGLKTYCQRYSECGEYKYIYFSERLYNDQYKRKESNAAKKADEHREMERRIRSGRKYKRRKYDLQSFIAEEQLALQKRLKNMTLKELRKRMFEASLTGREGFFLLISSKNLTGKQALTIYRNRDAVEKLIDSLKNVVKLKPVRVWTSNAIKGALMIGFLAQLIVALLRYDNDQLIKLRPKTIVQSLRNLTLTIEHQDLMIENRIISNFDEINMLILKPEQAVT